MKSMYQAQVTSHGGRNGKIKSSDGILDMAVSVPKSMGGNGAATNPEQLFAAGYAACFENAVIHMARLKKLNPGETSVTAIVDIGPGEGGAFKLAVQLDVSVGGLDRATAQAVVDAAHQICPYSNATRGNIDVQLRLVKTAEG
jgi:lipoyl-dependent peroxiredoxin